jgi:sulfatase maturation enzyme AslB (radical SAM superfamily)
MKILQIKDDGVHVISKYNKYVCTDKYEIYFNTETGFELIRGIHGHDDPFSLEMPSLLDIGIMGHCKNKCEFCYQGDRYEDHMSLEKFKSIIDQVSAHTNQVALGGRGDPNHHPFFKEIIEYCRKSNVVPNYTTSGIDLTDEQVEISKQCGAVAVSDYGKLFTYKAIKKLQDADIKTNIHFLFTRESAHIAFTFLHGHNPWGKKVDLKKLNAVIFLLFKNAGLGADCANLIPSTDQLKMFSDLVTKNGAQTKIGMDSCMVNHITVPKNMEMFMTSCEAGRFSAYITPRGGLLPCSFLSQYYHKLGETPHPIRTTWLEGDTFDLFRNILRDSTMCPCGYNYQKRED